MTFLLALVLPLSLQLPPDQPAAVPQARLRMLDLTADGRLDRLWFGAGQPLVVEVNRGDGVFRPVSQELPIVQIAQVLCDDLNGDGWADLYLVSPAENVALLGDGTGRLREATGSLGLADRGHGLSAERVDLDGRVPEELLLHNREGDVVFWARSSSFERDPRTPEPVPGGADDLDALVAVILQAASDPALLGPDVEVALGTAADGRPLLTLARRAAAPAGSAPQAQTSPGPGLVLPRSAGGTIGGPGPASFGFNAEYQEILSYMEMVDLPDGGGGWNRTIRLRGVNLQIVNGTGATNGQPGNPAAVGEATTSTNGLGNLILGYNEFRGDGGDRRSGSHNLVIGSQNNFSGFGGMVVGQFNTIERAYASVAGGFANMATGSWSTVTGGANNVAGPDLAGSQGVAASVSGGRGNHASGDFSSILAGGDDPDDPFDAGNDATGVLSAVLGGSSNQASGRAAAVAGGLANLASGIVATVSGGRNNQALGTGATVAGGGTSTLGNVASGDYAVVSGGFDNVASGVAASVSGGRRNVAAGAGASVSGGGGAVLGNLASGTYAWVGGGTGHTASGHASVVSAGQDNAALGPHSSVSGGRNNVAFGEGSSVAGGAENRAEGDSAVVGGGLQNQALGFFSVINGGYQNLAPGLLSAINGGNGNLSGGTYSAVGGGANRTSPGTSDWSAGGLFETD